MKSTKNQIKFSKSLDLLPISVMLISREGTILDWNKRSDEVFELEKKETIGKNLLSLFDKQSRKGIAAFIEEVLNDRSKRRFPIFTRSKKGRPQFIELRASQEQLSGDNSTAMIVFVDVTEREIAREALEDSKKELEVIFSNVADGITVQDRKGNLIFVNDCAAKMMGFNSVKELAKLKSHEVMKGFEMYDTAGNPFPLHKLPGRRALEGEKNPQELVYFKNKRFGTYHWTLIKATPIIDEEGNIEQAVNVFHDITKEKKSADELRASQERYRELFENANDIVYTHDLAGNFTAINKAGEKFIGYSRKELMGMKITDIIAPEYYEKAAKMLQKKIKEKTPTVYEVEVITKSGQRVLLELSSRLIYEGDLPKEVQGIARDITERKQNEEQRDFFIGLASHELKTPLASIKAFTQMLLRKFEKKGDTQTAQYLSKIDIKVDTLTKLINDLLDITRIRAGKLDYNDEVFEFDQMITDIVESLQPAFSHHKIVKKGSTDTYIVSDRGRIEQVVTNLLKNAVKYSPDSEKIELEVSNDKKAVHFKVRDFGVGIEKEELPKIFRPFYRSKMLNYKPEGLGLGLFISSEIVNHYGGRIVVESVKDKGTAFTVTLPVKPNRKK